MSSKLPFVFVNVAITADGKIATANRAVSSFSSQRDRDNMMELRSVADAVMAGARTVDLNPVNLGPGAAKYRRVRKRLGFAEYNLRIIVSGSGGIDPNAEIFKRKFSPIIVLTAGSANPEKLNRLRTLADEVKSFGQQEIDFRKALAWLREKWNVKRLLCEGGGELNDALFRAGVVNELHLTICPKIFGGHNAPTLSDGAGILKLSAATHLKLKSMTRIGDELFTIYDCLVSTNRAKSHSKSARRFR